MSQWISMIIGIFLHLNPSIFYHFYLSGLSGGAGAYTSCPRVREGYVLASSSQGWHEQTAHPQSHSQLWSFQSSQITPNTGSGTTVEGSHTDTGRICKLFHFSHHPSCKMVRLKTPLVTVGFIIHQVVLHHLIFRFKQGVTGSTLCCTSAIIH